jgi:hypothetical protein
MFERGKRRKKESITTLVVNTTRVVVVGVMADGLPGFAAMIQTVRRPEKGARRRHTGRKSRR